jgi:hypothetical protein
VSQESEAAGDLYAVLQVHANAEPEVIEAAYRRLARKYHPDVNPAPDAEARMRALNHAHAVLSEPARRAAYDRRGAAAEPARDSREANPAADFAEPAWYERPSRTALLLFAATAVAYAIVSTFGATLDANLILWHVHYFAPLVLLLAAVRALLGKREWGRFLTGCVVAVVVADLYLVVTGLRSSPSPVTGPLQWLGYLGALVVGYGGLRLAWNRLRAR